MGRKSSLMHPLSYLEAAPLIRPGLDKACPLSEAHRRRLYAEMYASFEKEAAAAQTRCLHLSMLIGWESSVYLGGGLHQRIGEARRYTERRRQLKRALEEEDLQTKNWLRRMFGLLDELDDARLCIVPLTGPLMGRDPLSGYECVPASAEARLDAGYVHNRLEAGCVHHPEKDIGAPSTEAKSAPLLESAQHLRLRPPRSSGPEVCAV